MPALPRIASALVLSLVASGAFAEPSARASLRPTDGQAARGSLAFEAVPGGVRVTGRVEGLGAGATHGFHVHEKGDCSAPDGSSAGAHFNPGGHAHGGPHSAQRHLGDLPNLTADAQGVATVDATIDDAALGDGSANDLLLRAVIVHAAADDYATQPTGNSGARIACGVIQ